MKTSIHGRLLALALVLIMVVSMLPMTALAGGETATYTKVTKADELTSGKYVLMVSTGYAMGKLDGTWVTAEQPTVTGDGISVPDGAAYVWDLTFKDGSVTLTDVNSTSIAPKGGNTNGIASGSYGWGYAFSNGTVRFTGNGSDTVTLASNKSSDNKFRAYKNGTISNQPGGYPCDFTLYKLDAAPARESGVVADLSTLKSGDQVVIFNPANKKALSTQYSGYYNKGVDVTLTDGKLTGFTEAELWTVGINSDGTYTFATKDGKKLSMGTDYTSTPLDDVNPNWKVTAVEGKTALFYIDNAARTDKYRLQWYADKNSWSAYKGTGTNFEQQFYYVAEADIPGGGGDDPGPVVTGPIADGDYVLYVPAYQKALSSVYSGYYNSGVSMTIADTDTSVEAAQTEIWTVKNNADGTIYLSTANGDKLAMAADKTSMPLNEVNDKWTVEKAADGLYYVKNVGRGAYIEWFKDKGTFSAYYSIASGSEDLFRIRFVPATVKAGGETGDLPKAGDQVVIYNQNAKAVLAAQDDNAESPAITKALAVIQDGKAIAENGAVIFTVERNGEYYRFKNKTYGYLCATGTGNNAFYSETASDDADWLVRTCSGGVGGFEMESRTAKYKGHSQWLEYYSDSFKVYSMYNVTDYTIYSFNFYPVAESVKVTEGIVNMPVVNFGTVYDAYVGQDYTFSFTVNSVFGVQGDLTVLVNGEAVPATLKDGVYSATVPAAKLAGQNTLEISVTGKDVKGVDIKGSVSVNVKDEPVITNVSPAANAQTHEEKRPLISAEIINAGENPVVQMTINDVSVEAVYQDGKLTYKPSKDMEDGRVTVKITVERKDGKKAELSWSFTVGESKYQLYFGQLHSHTGEYSDGSGTLADALNYVKNLPESANVDFVAFTDHSNYFDSKGSANPEGALYDMTLATAESQQKWKKYKDDIAAFNQENAGKLVAIGGFEMTWSGGPGHINTFSTPGIVSRNNDTLNNKTNDAGLKAYYELLSRPEGADSISQFNHPGSTFGTFIDFSYYDAVIGSRMYLVEVGNGEGQIGAGGYYPSYEQYKHALDKGWKVAPTNNQDNHKGRWGNANDARDVILTDNFTEEGIYEAIRAHRVYATEDKNLEISYTLNDLPLGSIISKEAVPEKLNINVTVFDPDKSDSISKVEVIVNSGKVAYTWGDPAVLTSGELNCTLDPVYSYYYIRVTQGDGDLAVTAPVWVGDSLKLGVTSFESETSTPVTGEALNLTTALFNSESSDATVKSITYSCDGTKLLEKTAADLSDEQRTLKASSTMALSFPLTFDVAKVYNLTATVVLTLKGEDYTFTKELALDVLNADDLVYIGIDASHYNEYVAGNYKDSMGNFGTLAASYSVRTNELKTSQDLIDACSNPKYKMLILTAPSRRDGEALRNPYATYTDQEIAALQAFNSRGGVVVLAGWSDYYEKYAAFPAEDHMAAQQNKILAALGSSLRINDDATHDDTLNGGQSQRLYLSSYNFDSFLLDRVEFDEEHPNDVMYTERYSQYGGASIYVVDADGQPTAAVPSTVTPVVFGHASTYTKDSDNDGKVDQKYSFKDGDDRVLVTATEQLEGKGLIVVSGAAFMSNFEVQYQASDSGAEKNYSNYKICENLIKSVNPLKITPIGVVNKQTEKGYKYTIEGIVTSNASGYDKDTAFFDCIYVQDETGGINVFPVAGNYKIGDKVRITGTTDFYQSEIELTVSSIEKIGEGTVTPKEVTATQINDKSVLGELVTLKGVVTRIEYANGLVQTIMIRDKDGVEARVFIDGYITTQNEVQNLKMGCEIEATGLSSLDDTFKLSDGTYVLARIRIRDRADIICGKVVEEHTHKFGAWVVTKEPTATEPGLKERVCACGEKEVVEIPALGKDPQTGDSSNLTLWIVIMAVAIVGAAVALFFLLKKRKSNKD